MKPVTDEVDIGALVEQAVRDGLFINIDGVLHKCYRGDLSNPRRCAPFPMTASRVKILWQQDVWDVSDARMLYVIQRGEWPYGMWVRRNSEGQPVSTIASNSWVTEAVLDAVLADYRKGMQVCEISARHGVSDNTVRNLAKQWLSPQKRKAAEGLRQSVQIDNRAKNTCACGATCRGAQCWVCARKRPRGTCACGNRTNRGRDVCCDCRKVAQRRGDTGQ